MHGRKVLFAVIAFGAITATVAIGISAIVWYHGGDGKPTRAASAELTEASATASTYSVDARDSEAQFVIQEVLRGRPNTVVGTTNQIAGSVTIDFENESVAVGAFEINARTFRTDDEMRDRTIRSLILETNRDDFEFLTFRPHTIDGASGSYAAGGTLTFEVSGDLAIRNIRRETVFEVELSIESARALIGTARASIQLSDFGIRIPYVGGDSIVASVEDRAELRMNFVARTGL